MKWQRPVLLGILCAAILDIPIYYYFKCRQAAEPAGVEQSIGVKSRPTADEAAPFDLTEARIKIRKLTPALTLSPEFQVFRATGKLAEYRKWLEVEAEFSVNLPNNSDWIDELTFEYLVEVNGKLCPGEVAHADLTSGMACYSIIYLPPRNLERLIEGKLLSQNLVGNVWLKVTRNGELLAEKSLKPGAPENLPRVSGMLVPKAETPFRDLWWDRYETLKMPGVR